MIGNIDRGVGTGRLAALSPTRTSSTAIELTFKGGCDETVFKATWIQTDLGVDAVLGSGYAAININISGGQG